ncbi:MAG: DUF4258 domain-containing protein [Nitrospira sp.]|nr:DUF4258 domain-containing protein [Nitrospira sp.]
MRKPLRYDRHARRRMKWRKISEQEVEAVLSVPDKVEQTERERMNAFRRIGSRYLKVTYREFADEILIISAVDKSD